MFSLGTGINLEPTPYLSCAIEIAYHKQSSKIHYERKGYTMYEDLYNYGNYHYTYYDNSYDVRETLQDFMITFAISVP